MFWVSSKQQQAEKDEESQKAPPSDLVEKEKEVKSGSKKSKHKKSGSGKN